MRSWQFWEIFQNISFQIFHRRIQTFNTKHSKVFYPIFRKKHYWGNFVLDLRAWWIPKVFDFLLTLSPSELKTAFRILFSEFFKVELNVSFEALLGVIWKSPVTCPYKKSDCPWTWRTYFLGFTFRVDAIQPSQKMKILRSS